MGRQMRAAFPPLADPDQPRLQQILGIGIFVAAIFGAAGRDHPGHRLTRYRQLIDRQAEGALKQDHRLFSA